MLIRQMERGDEARVLTLMRAFYASPAVLSDGSEEVFCRDIAACVGDCPYLSGYVFCADGAIVGYAMTAHSFSTEFGKPCVWIEDLYLDAAHRSGGAGGQFLRFLQQRHPDAVLRLEVEEENTGAIRLYEKHGYEILPYLEMKMETKFI